MEKKEERGRIKNKGEGRGKRDKGSKKREARRLGGEKGSESEADEVIGRKKAVV